MDDTAHPGNHAPHHVPEPAAKPAIGVHPEDVDPLGKAHAHHSPISAEERRTVFILTVALVAAVLLVPIISVISYSPALNVFLGLSPLILTLIIDIIATRQHYKTVVFWGVLIVIHMFALAIIYFLNPLLAVPMNVPAAVTTSLFLGVIVTAFATLTSATSKQPSRAAKTHVVQFRPERIDEYVHSIEDKVKALNFAIGRVYRASNGGSSKMRERLRIPSEWYNEFSVNGTDSAAKLEKARVLVRKIRDRLALYSMQEKDVFSKDEVSSFKNIRRDADGKDAVIDVLKRNDSDPVEHYYVSAVEFCDRILEELERK